MSSINKINIYECDTCKRVIEQKVDGSRPDPLRCIITNKCRGKLSLIGMRHGLQPKFVKPVIGLDDWVQRGSESIDSAKTISSTKSSISSFSGNGGLTLGVVKFRDVGNDRQFYVNCNDGTESLLETRPKTYRQPLQAEFNLVLYELTPEILVYRHYSYNFTTAASIITGQDDSASQSALRFNASNIVKVFANGIELPDTAFNRSISNKITLTPTIYDSNIVIDIFVYNDISNSYDESTALNLTFKPLDVSNGLALRNLCSWGDVFTIGNTTQTVLFYCADFGVLDKSKSYGVAKLTAGTKEIISSDAIILLSQPPYAFEDKLLTKYVKVTSMISGGIISFMKNTITGIDDMVIDDANISESYLPIKINTKLTNLELTNPLSQEVTSHAIEYVLQSPFILGPR